MEPGSRRVGDWDREMGRLRFLDPILPPWALATIDLSTYLSSSSHGGRTTNRFGVRAFDRYVVCRMSYVVCSNSSSSANFKLQLESPRERKSSDSYRKHLSIGLTESINRHYEQRETRDRRG